MNGVAMPTPSPMTLASPPAGGSSVSAAGPGGKVGVDPLPRAGHERLAAAEQKAGLVAAGNGKNVGCASACGHRSPPALEANSAGP